MSSYLWLPKDYELPDKAIIKKLLYKGENWQIIETSSDYRILLASRELGEKWLDNKLLNDSILQTIVFNESQFFYLKSQKNFLTCPIMNGDVPESKVDALAFAHALRQARERSHNNALNDSIYIEQFSKLLPIWTESEPLNDKEILGFWLTGGVNLSIDSFRRLNSLCWWLNADELIEIINAAGFDTPHEALSLTKKKSYSNGLEQENQTLIDEKTSRTERDAIKNKEFKLPGRPKLELFFNEHIIDIIFNLEKYQHLGIDFPSALIMHGPPGCGKTYAAEKLIEHINWPHYSINSNSVGSPYIHETSKKISEIFDTAINNAPSIVVIDEMEAFLSDRRDSASSGSHRIEEVAEFLRRIPEAIKNKVLIIAMTNHIDMIDPAILRRGRFDHILEVEMPSKEEVSSLIESLLSKIPKADNLDLSNLIHFLTGKALSESAFVIREAARIAARSGKTRIDQESIDTALNSLPQTNTKTHAIGFTTTNK